MSISKPFLLIFLFLVYIKAFSGNIYGSDISWKRLTIDSFEIKIEVYNDCAKPLDSINPEIIPLQCTPTFPIKFEKCISHTTFDVSRWCSKDRNKCDVSANLPYGIVLNTFIYKIYLGANSNCCWYKLVLKGLTRDNQIANGNAGVAFETSATLNKCDSNNLASVEFKNRGVLIKYKGDDVMLNHGVVLLSGDSISYAMQTPINSNFIKPYSETYPFACYGGNVKPSFKMPFYGFGLDSITGNISCRPIENGYFIFRMEAKQWKKLNNAYTLVGISNREMMFLVADKPITNAPTLTGPYSYKCHPGQQICININTSDIDVDDTVRVHWDRRLFNASFTNNNGQAKHASANICWTPSDNDASCLPYYFSVTAIDDNCWRQEQTSKEYSIMVIPTIISENKITKINCHTYQFKNTPVNRSGCLANLPYETKWFEPKLIGTGIANTLIGTQDSIRYDFKTGGRHLLKYSFATDGVINVYFDTLNIDTFGFVKIINSDSTINAKDTVILFATTSCGKKNNEYQWWGNGILLDTNATIKVYPSVTTTYTIINKGLFAPCDVTEDNITLTIPGTIGIHNKTIKDFPYINNPFNEKILFLNDGIFEQLTLYSMEGKYMLYSNLDLGLNSINTCLLSSGVYILELKKDDRNIRIKVIKI